MIKTTEVVEVPQVPKRNHFCLDTTCSGRIVHEGEEYEKYKRHMKCPIPYNLEAQLPPIEVEFGSTREYLND